MCCEPIHMKYLYTRYDLTFFAPLNESIKLSDAPVDQPFYNNVSVLYPLTSYLLICIINNTTTLRAADNFTKHDSRAQLSKICFGETI